MALRLAQRNRLRELEAKLEDAELGVEEAQAKVERISFGPDGQAAVEPANIQ